MRGGGDLVIADRESLVGWLVGERKKKEIKHSSWERRMCDRGGLACREGRCNDETTIVIDIVGLIEAG